MRAAAFLFFLLTLFPLAAQHPGAEDAALRRRIADGQLTTDEYAQRAADLLDVAEELGGYPVIPVDSLGRYRLTRSLTTDRSLDDIRQVTERWLALGGFAGEGHYAFTSNRSFVRYLTTPYQFADQHRELLSDQVTGSYPVTVSCVLEVRQGQAGPELILSDPVLTEAYVATYDPGFDDALQYVVRERRAQIGDFLPVVDGRPKEYAARLRYAKVIDACLKGLADSLEAFLQ